MWIVRNKQPEPSHLMCLAREGTDLWPFFAPRACMFILIM